MVNYKLVVLGEGGVGKSGESQLTHTVLIDNIQSCNYLKRLHVLLASVNAMIFLHLCLTYFLCLIAYSVEYCSVLSVSQAYDNGEGLLLRLQSMHVIVS